MKIYEKRMNKRGLSVIIGYILLVSIGLALSTMVYSWLVFYIPSGEVVECPDGLSLSIKEVRCDSINRVLNFSVKNTGLFSVDGFTVKVNDKPSSSVGVFSITDELTKVIPGRTMEFSYGYYELVVAGPLKSDLTLLELQPMIKDEQGNYTFCQPMVKEVLDCSLRGEICFGGIDEDQDGLTDCDDVDDCRFDVSCSYLDSNLLLHYTFDYDSAHDFTGNNADGTVTGAKHDSTGGYDDIGGAYKFFGASDEITVAEASSMITSDSITISFWLKRDSSDNAGKYFIGVNDFLNIGRDQNDPSNINDDYFVFGNASIEISALEGSSPRNEWNLFTFVYDSNGDAVIYKDELSVGSGNIGAGMLTNPSGDFKIGIDNNLKGFIDEVRIYDYALSEEDVGELWDFYTG